MIIRKFCFLFFCLWVTSCENPTDSEIQVIHEDIIYLSGETVRIMGRIVAAQTIVAEDHGFYLDKTEGFLDPIVISLGSVNQPGRFLAQFDGLKEQTVYYAKAFIRIGDEVIFSEVFSFQTLQSEVANFLPSNGRPGEVIEISGRNFSAETKVFFGNREAEILDILLESKIRAKIPGFEGDVNVPITVMIGERILELPEPFEYITGKYERLGELLDANNKLFDNIYFEADGEFYVGLGTIGRTRINPTIWKYNSSSQSWLETGYPGQASRFGFGSSGFFGGGTVSLNISQPGFNREFWRIIAGGFQRLADLPFDKFRAVAFTLKDRLFLAGGSGSGREIHAFDPDSQSWNLETQANFPIADTVLNFGFGQKQYFINPTNEEIMAYDLATRHWEKAGDFPGKLTGGGLAVVWEGKAYIGLLNGSNRMWEWDLATGEWRQKNHFPGALSAENIGVFTGENKIYFLRRTTGPMEFWSFDPYGY